MAPDKVVFDLTLDDSEDESSTRAREPALRVNEKGYIEIFDSDSDSAQRSSSRRSIPQPRNATPRNVRSKAATSNSALPENTPPKPSQSKDVAPRGRPRNDSLSNGQSSRDRLGSKPLSTKTSTLPAETSMVTPTEPSNPPTVFPNSSGPQINQSPRENIYPNKQPRLTTRQSFARDVEDDVPIPRERPGNVPSSSLRRSPKGKEVALEPASSTNTTPHTSSRLTGKVISYSRLDEDVEEAPPIVQKSKDQSLPAAHQSPSEDEAESGSESEFEEEPASQVTQEDDRPHSPGTPSRKSSRSTRASQRTIPDSTVNSSSPLLVRLKEKQLKNGQSTSDSRPRNESPRDVMSRHSLSKRKEREPLKPQETQTVQQLEQSLREFEQDMKEVHALTVRNLLHDAREAEAEREHLFVDAVSPFASLKCIQLEPKDPIPKGAYAEKLDSYVSQTVDDFWKQIC